MVKLESNAISINNAGYYHTSYKYSSITRLHDFGKMHGPRRVAVFCLLTAVLPTILIIIPLYLRHSLFADVYYQVAESDIFEIHEGMSSIFCEEHTLQMNNTFNAYQLSSLPEINNNRKHIRLKKSMELPDDTLEYWGFYLLKDSTVGLRLCSRYDGSKILVVRGERNLRTCGLLEHNKNKPNYDKEYKQVKVTFETPAQEITNSQEKFIVTFPKNKTLTTNMNINDVNTGAEIQDSELELELLKQQAEDYIRTHNRTGNTHNKRHARQRFRLEQDAIADGLNIRVKRDVHGKQIGNDQNIDSKRNLLERELNEDGNKRDKRETGHKLDGAIGHGGNAINHTADTGSEESNSQSSFETNLLDCYDGQILVSQEVPPSELCEDVHYLARGEHMQMIHEVVSDGYYYYIFYSDNDLESNHIHAVFDIHKPTFRYTNVSDTKTCLNSTECNFGVSFFSDETVIVEIPTKDGIEHDDDDISMLVSKCKPRMAIYIIFPITILFLILGCAFL